MKSLLQRNMLIGDCHVCQTLPTACIPCYTMPGSAVPEMQFIVDLIMTVMLGYIRGMLRLPLHAQQLQHHAVNTQECCIALVVRQLLLSVTN